MLLPLLRQLFLLCCTPPLLRSTPGPPLRAASFPLLDLLLELPLERKLHKHWSVASSGSVRRIGVRPIERIILLDPPDVTYEARSKRPNAMRHADPSKFEREQQNAGDDASPSPLSRAVLAELLTAEHSLAAAAAREEGQMRSVHACCSVFHHSRCCCRARDVQTDTSETRDRRRQDGMRRLRPPQTRTLRQTATTRRGHLASGAVRRAVSESGSGEIEGLDGAPSGSSSRKLLRDEDGQILFDPDDASLRTRALRCAAG